MYCAIAPGVSPSPIRERPMPAVGCPKGCREKTATKIQNRSTERSRTPTGKQATRSVPQESPKSKI